MRIIDADILSYALYDEHIAHPYAWPFVERAIKGEMVLHVTQTTLLETYNTLFWFYKVRPREKLLEKMREVVACLKIVSTSIEGIRIALEDGIPLGDGFLIATAIENKIPIIVSNDEHIVSKAPRHDLFVENPIPESIRKRMAKSIR